MEAVKNWSFSICCASVFCGILNLLIPEASTHKIFKAVIYVFFLSVIVSTFSDFDFTFFQLAYTKEDKEISFEDNEFNNISEDFIKDEIITATEEILSSEEIKAKNISLKVNISAEGSINIIDFTITLPDGTFSEGLSAKIYQKTGLKPEIIISGEN